MLIATLILMFGAGTNQPSVSGLYGDIIPKEAATFLWKGVYVAFRVDKEWVKNESTLNELPKTKTIEVFRDAPWTPQTAQRILPPTIPDDAFERREDRKTRLEKGWEEAGYHRQDPLNEGEGLFVPAAELEAAQKAEQAEHDTLASWHPEETTIIEQAVSPVEEVAPESPSFMQQWGGHIVLVLVAGALIGTVVKMLILEGS